MIRQTIVIGPYTYLIDVFDANKDLRDDAHYAEFVMLRNFKLLNNVTTDKDIFLIDKEIFDDVVEELYEHQYDLSDDVVTSKCVLPVPNKKLKNFSAKFNSFNENITKFSLYTNYTDKHNYDFGTDVYPLYNDNNELAKILCDKCRIYHPVNCSHNNLIIYVDNYINNIHFHYFCKKISDYDTKSETIFKYNNREYFEYVEFYFPNIHDLFDEHNQIFYNEDLDIVSSQENLHTNDATQYTNDDNQFVPVKLLIQPFKIVEQNGRNTKRYINIHKSIENNYLTHPFNVTLFAYDELDETTYDYYIDEYLQSSTNTFLTECRFTLSSRLGFSNGKISLLNTFNYPNKELFDTLKQAYEHYNCVNQEQYDDYFEEYDKIMYDDINKLTYADLTNKDKQMVMDYTMRYNMNKREMLEEYKKMRIASIRAELIEEIGTDETFLGFMIQLSSTTSFVNPVYSKNVTIKFSELDDFAFELNNIFESWNELPEHLIARVIFVDRLLGTMIHSNNVVITKEWFKYMVNDLNIYSLSQLKSLNETYTQEKTINNDMKTFNVSDDTVNFLNNITCIVNTTEHNDRAAVGIDNKPKILYKPIFYRVNDLQNVKIRQNVTQNIGVNLADYMTKVETFKLWIENNEFIETARNDVYVIFSINANKLLQSSGRYDILNQDDEYISTGTYTIY